MALFRTLAVVCLFLVQFCVISWHFMCTDCWGAPLINDYLLHFIESRYVYSIIVSNQDGWLLSKFDNIQRWGPLRLVDHILGSHGCSFPFFHHYQHFPHLIVGIFGALIKDVDLSFTLATCLTIGLLLPLSIYYSLVKVLKFHPLGGIIGAVLMLPAINDAPPAGQMQQGYHYNYGVGWGAYLHGGHGLWTQPFALCLLFLSFSFTCKAMAGIYSAMMTTNKNNKNEKISFCAGFHLIMVPSLCAGLMIGWCGLSNVLIGYMAAVNSVAITFSSLAILLMDKLSGKKINSPHHGESSHLNVSRSTKHSVFIQQSVFMLMSLALSGLIGFLISAYFIIPHTMASHTVSNYEARDYKLSGEGIIQAFSVLAKGDMFDHGCKLNSVIEEEVAAITNMSNNNTEFGFSSSLALLLDTFINQSQAAMNSYLESNSQENVGSFSELSWAQYGYTLVSFLMKMIMYLTTTLISILAFGLHFILLKLLSFPETFSFFPSITTLVLVSLTSITLFGFHQIDQDKADKITDHMKRKVEFEKRIIQRIALNSAAFLFLFFLVLYGGYGNSSNIQIEQNLSSSMIGLALPAAIGKYINDAFTSESGRTVELFLSNLVLKLPLISSLHLHRFLIGTQFVSIIMIPISLEVFTLVLHTILWSQPFLSIECLLRRFGSSSNINNNNHNIEVFDSNHRSNSIKKYRVVSFLFILLLLSPNLKYRLNFMIREMETRTQLAMKHKLVFSSELKSMSLKAMKISTNSNTLQQNGRVYSGDRNSFYSSNFFDDHKMGDKMDESFKDRVFDDIPFVRLPQLQQGSFIKFVDIVGPLLHGLSPAADLLVECDFMNNKMHRHVFGVTSLLLPTHWLKPFGNDNIPEDMIEVIPLTNDMISSYTWYQHYQQQKNACDELGECTDDEVKTSNFEIYDHCFDAKTCEMSQHYEKFVDNIPIFLEKYLKNSESKIENKYRLFVTPGEIDAKYVFENKYALLHTDGSLVSSHHHKIVESKSVLHEEVNKNKSKDEAKDSEKKEQEEDEKLNSQENYQNTNNGYFSLGRVLAFPPAFEHVLSTSDVYSLSTSTSAHLRPVSASEIANHFDLAATNPLFNKLYAIQSMLVDKIRDNFFYLISNSSLLASLSDTIYDETALPATPAQVHRLTQAWLLGLKDESTLPPSSSPQNLTSSLSPLFYLAWPTRSAFESYPAKKKREEKLFNDVGEQVKSLPQIQHGEYHNRWRSQFPHINGNISNVVVSPLLEKFECDVYFTPHSNRNIDVINTDHRHETFKVPDANLVLKVTHHTGWKCFVSKEEAVSENKEVVSSKISSTTWSKYQEVAVGRILPGFVFIDLFADNKETKGFDAKGQEDFNESREKHEAVVSHQRVRCEYYPSAVKGYLLILSLTTAFVVGISVFICKNVPR